jgi:hypothetical protein
MTASDERIGCMTAARAGGVWIVAILVRLISRVKRGIDEKLGYSRVSHCLWYVENSATPQNRVRAWDGLIFPPLKKVTCD